jgi:hypothetical protein
LIDGGRCLTILLTFVANLAATTGFKQVPKRAGFFATTRINKTGNINSTLGLATLYIRAELRK